MIDNIHEQAVNGFYAAHPFQFSLDALQALRESGQFYEFTSEQHERELLMHIGWLGAQIVDRQDPEEELVRRRVLERSAPELFKAAYGLVFEQLGVIGARELVQIKAEKAAVHETKEALKFERDKKVFFKAWGVTDPDKQTEIVALMEQGNFNVVKRITPATEPERERTRKAREDFMKAIGMRVSEDSGFIHSASGLPISPKNIFDVSVSLAKNKVDPRKFYATGGRHTYLTGKRVRKFIHLMKKNEIPFVRVLESAPQAAAHLDTTQSVIDHFTEAGYQRVLKQAPEIVAYDIDVVQKRLAHLATYGIGLDALVKSPRLILNRRETITAKVLPYFDTTDALGVPREIAQTALGKYPNFLETGLHKGRVIQRVVKSFIPKESIGNYIFNMTEGDTATISDEGVVKFANLLDKLQKCPTERLLDVVEHMILGEQICECERLVAAIKRSKAKADPHKPLDMQTAIERWPRIYQSRHGTMLLSSYIATTRTSSRARKGRPVSKMV